MAGIVAVVGLYSLSAGAQPAPAPAAWPLTAEQLERLVAPIALYPDPLVAQILMAATYPLEVVEADRWLQIPANAALKADALTAGLQQQSWDPSIKSLVPFPQLLNMMDRHLDWTEQLGDAFLAQQADVMDAIQRLRGRAQASGALASTPQQTVSTAEQEIMIEPAAPEIVYVPVYNPWCIYGAWPYPDYPPFYFGGWSGYCGPADYLIAFGAGFYPFGFWAWGHFEWRHHIIRVDHDRYERFHTGHEPPGESGSTIQAIAMACLIAIQRRRHGSSARPAQRAVTRGYAPAPTVVPAAKPALPSVGRGPATISRPTPGLARRSVRCRRLSNPLVGVRKYTANQSADFPAAWRPRRAFAARASFHAAAAVAGFHGGGGGGGGCWRRRWAPMRSCR